MQNFDKILKVFLSQERERNKYKMREKNPENLIKNIKMVYIIKNIKIQNVN